MNWLLQNPWMLFWGLGCLLPLLFYRMRQSTRQSVPWAAMSFLRDAPKSSITRKRWRRWLLLATRVSLPLLVAFIAASPGCLRNPMMVPDKTGSTLDGQTHWWLVIDNSASMGPRQGTGGQQSALREAKRQAIQFINEASDRDVFTVIASEESGTRQLRTPVGRQAAIESVSAIAPGYGRFQWSEVLRRVDRAVRRIAKDRLNQKANENFRLAVLSDFQQTDWLRFNSNPQVALPNDLDEVRIVDCRIENAAASNFAITKIWSEPAAALTGQRFECKVTVQGPANEAVSVALFHNGQAIAQQQVTCDSQGTATAAYKLESDKLNSGEIANASSDKLRSIELIARLQKPSGLLIDDQRYIAVSLQQKIRVKLIHDATESGLALPNRFAVALDHQDPKLVPFDVSILPVGDIPEAVTDADVVALFGLSSLQSIQVEALLTFARQGGTVVVSPEEDFAASQRLLNALSPVNGSSFQSRIQSGDFRFDPIEYRHPVLKRFKSQPNAGIIDVPIRRFHQVDLPNSADPILNFDSGAPALFSIDEGAGRFIFATTPLTVSGSAVSGSETQQSWNELSAWWSYVPLVNELLTWSFGANDAGGSLVVGETWKPSADLFRLANELDLEAPNQTSQAASLRIDRSTLVQVNSPGFWRLRTSPSTVFAANVDADESDPQLADLSAVREWVSKELGGKQAESDGSINATKGEIDKAFTARFVMGLAIALIVLLFAESALARPIGGRDA